MESLEIEDFEEILIFSAVTSLDSFLNLWIRSFDSDGDDARRSRNLIYNGDFDKIGIGIGVL